MTSLVLVTPNHKILTKEIEENEAMRKICCYEPVEILCYSIGTYVYNAVPTRT